jgi:hypothetical protein
MPVAVCSLHDDPGTIPTDDPVDTGTLNRTRIDR